MPHPSPPLIAAGALALVVTACGSAAMHPSTPPGTPSGVPYPERPNEIQRGAKPPVPRRNPNPVAYEITLTIENAPGPFAVVNAGMAYDVESPLCLPRLGGMSGTRVQARHTVPVELQRISPNKYRALVYDNLYVDEDYYGLGICRWRLGGVGFGLKATGRPGETRFGEYLLHREITDGNEVRAYFAPLYYPAAPTFADYPAEGERDPLRFKPELRGDLFAFDFQIRKLAP